VATITRIANQTFRGGRDAATAWPTQSKEEPTMLWLKRFWMEEEGAEVTEWALLVVVLALAILAGGPTLQTTLSGALSTIGGQVQANASQIGVAGE
jgi:Flp pilus assembly pilin Flp